MDSERLWILVLVATTFCAGLAGGILFGFRFRPEPPAGPFEPYRARLVREFELGEPEDLRLRQALQAYDEEIEALKDRYVREMEAELVAAGEACRSRIRSGVIPPERRAEFDRLTGAIALSAASTR